MNVIHSWPQEQSEPDFARHARVLMGVAGAEARSALTHELEAEGYLVENTTTGLELRVRLLGSQISGDPFELVVVDLDLPGPPVLEAIAAGPEAPKVIVIAGAVTEPVNRDAVRLGAVIVDRFVAAADVRDTAAALVTPVQLDPPTAA